MKERVGGRESKDGWKEGNSERRKEGAVMHDG